VAKKRVAKKTVPKIRVSKKKTSSRKPAKKRTKLNEPDQDPNAPLVNSASFSEEEGQLSSFAAYQGGSSARGEIRSGLTKRALCIGIDQYPNPNDRLGGCVNDARNWSNWLHEQDFKVEMLTDAQATHSGITNAIGRIIRESQPGHVIAIQYAGHGTRLPDQDGEERDKYDEALVPHDHRENGYVLDDDLAALCSQIPTGVSVTFLMDCCHSGTMTRLFVGSGTTSADAGIRYLRPDKEMLKAHRRAKQRAATSRSTRSLYRDHSEILMSACRADQTAKEHDGQGDFTRYALTVLRQGISGVTNAEFIDRVRVIGSWQDQRPQLWSDPRFYHQSFLGTKERGEPVDDHTPGEPDQSELSTTLADLESVVRRLRNQLGA